jgi:hypothetical protein
MAVTKESDAWQEGGCHCGAVRYRVRPRKRRVLECNCSICSKKGFLGLIVPADDFELLSGEGELESYRFNTRVAEHRFCRTCGIHPFSRPRSHPDSVDINLRCLDDGIDAFEIVPFDGRHWEESVGSIRDASIAFLPFVIFLALALVVGLGCDTSFVEAGPADACKEVAVQCVLPDGPLGVCEQIPCADGTSGPCLVCTPQH